MKRPIAKNRVLACCLMLTAVLVLGIIQWSFLPLLIQSGPISGHAVLEVSASHTSKFAAPFKALFGDCLKPRPPQSRVAAPRITQIYLHHPEERVSARDDVFFSDRQLRAPPSA
jgi:hypothetical protein